MGYFRRDVLAREIGQDFQKLQEGVYQAKRGTDLIRVIVRHDPQGGT